MKTNNYLGRHDENRGIILFGMIFGVLLVIILGITCVSNASKKNSKGVSSADGIASVIEKKQYDIEKFEIDGNKLVIEGTLNEKVTDSIISKLENVELVLKDKTGDKYIYKANYYIATDRIEFSSIPKDSKESEINLDEVAKGEYFVLLRMKYESSKTEEGYRYRYYTFNNQTQNNNLEYNGMNILFDSSESVSSYLTIEHK